MNEGYKLKIVPGYKGMAEFIKETRSNPDSDLQKLWFKCVIDPYWSEWASGQFNEERTRAQMQNPIIDNDKLSHSVELLNNSEIISIVEDAYRKIIEILPSPEDSKVICIYANPYLGENVGGVMGSCVGDNILLQINASFPGWEAVVPWVLAHEYHHTVWGYHHFFMKKNTQLDLLTGLISDGQADSFAKSLNRDMEVSWINALSVQEEQEQWNIVKEYLGSTDENIYCRFFFGEEKTNTPGCTAYTIGYHIVQRYLKVHTEIDFNKLLDIDAQEILSDSGYDGRPIFSYKKLDKYEIEKLGEIDRSELVEYNYRCRNGKLELFNYYCDIKGFGEKQLEKHKENLYQQYDRGGTIFGAFEGSKLIGISSLDNKFLGKENDMLQLAFLHVSKDYRKKGIGKKLIELAKEKATELGAKRLYISGSPIKNTIEFYRAMGCKLVDEVEKALFELEPEDIHMELII